ncbi:hypothetical protein J2785_006743 [Burkholderia ambifaria]|nr:hypothetical protein [Burkholderia ambifaria]MDR6503550.1 hypothetical protein [Burkholderia ambifaria]
MADVTLIAPRAGRKDPMEAVRFAAYVPWFVAGENAAAARTNLFRLEMAVVLLGLGDAIAAGDRTDMVSWYGVAARVFAGGDCD